MVIGEVGSETWTLREQDTRVLLALEMKCLRTMLRVNRYDRLSNAYIRQTLGMEHTTEDVVSARRLRWFGHEMISASYKQDFKKARGVYVVP